MIRSSGDLREAIFFVVQGKNLAENKRKEEKKEYEY